MDDARSVSLGQSANLIRGLDAAWDPSAGRLNILYPAADQALTQEPVASAGDRGEWQYPDISLHENAQDMLTALIPYQVTSPSSDVSAPVLPGGALLMGAAQNPEALAQLSTTLGVDLSNPDYRYALVKLVRKDGEQAHASAASGILVHARPRTADAAFGVTESFHHAMTQLRHYGKQALQDYGDKVGEAEVTAYLEFFRTWGTHYVSRVETGDTILQVFAYPSEQFKRVKAAYADKTNPLSGPESTDFVYFTTDLNAGEYGFVKEYGHLLCLSNSNVFTDSLDAGKWLEKQWASKNSIFALFDDQAELTLSDLDETFVDSAQTGIELAPLSLFVEFKRILIWQRVLKAAMAQKYGDNITPNFAIYDKRNFVSLLPQDMPEVLSTIATPSINLYKSRIDLDKLQLVAADQVEDFTLFANVLSCAGNDGMNLPGQRVNLFGQVLDMRTSAGPHRLVLGDAAFDGLQLACDEFLGAMAVSNQAGSKHYLVVDGLQYGLQGEGREAEPVVVADVRRVPPVASLPALADSLQYSMTFAEAVISDQTASPNDGIQQLVRAYLRWLARFIPADTQDQALLALRVRALDLSSFASNPNYGSFVPILPYTDYEDYVEKILDYLDAIQSQIVRYQQQIAQRRQAELVIDVAKTLNENIVQSGELLSGIVSANAAQQQDMEGYYDSLITQQQAEAAQQQNKIEQLQGALFEQQHEVGAAVQVYKSAVQKWETMEAIKFGLDVATTLFSLGTSIAIPSSSIKAVAELGRLAQMIQKTLNVLNTSWKLYSTVKAGVEKLQDAQKTLDGLDGGQFGSPSSESWDEMGLNFKQVMASGPSGSEVNEAKVALETAFNLMVMRGKAVVNAKSSLHKIQRDIYTNQLQKEINQRQAQRLAALKDKLHPQQIQDLDKSGIDLIGLTGHLSFMQNQMLTILTKAFQLQDQALQYANLQPATPISSFSLMHFRSARVSQQAATIEAKSRLKQYQASTTRPIDFLIEGISPSAITGGSSHNFCIGLDAGEFHEYVNARVVAVVAEVDGIESTDSGDYLVQLSCDGTPFHDRDIERECHTYRTPWRERVYQYDAKTGEAKFTDGGSSWSDGVSRLTPFANWQLSLPATRTNKNIRFSTDNLTIHLRFVLEARIVDASAVRQQRMLRIAALTGMAKTEMLMAAPAPTLGALPSTPDLVSQMYTQGSCTNNWDVVFNMSLAQINQALKEQYEELKTGTEYKNVIDVTTKTPVVEGVWAIKKFYMEYGYPSLTFLTNNAEEAQLEMQVLKGSVQNCIQMDGSEPKCDPASSMDGETLTAKVKIGKVQGTISTDGASHDVLKVELDMQTGAFSISNIQLSDEEKVAFNKALKDYFVNNPVVFLINQLDLSQIPTLESLKPKGFLFKPLKTPSGNQMLQLFIMTGNRGLLDYSQTFLNNIPEPIPQGEQCSLMLRSGLFFSSVLPESLGKQGWRMEGVSPASGQLAWTGKFTQANVTGNVDLSKLNHTVTYPSEYSSTWTDFTYFIRGGNTVTWSLADTTMAAASDGVMRLNGKRNNSMGYVQKACTSYAPCFFNCSPSCSESNMSTDVTVDVLASLPLSVGGSGREQNVAIATTAKEVGVSGHLSGGGPSGSDDLKAQVNQQIKSQVPNQIVKQLNVSFEPISVFALKNLLFPSKNYIQFKGAYVPGDLLVVGAFVNLGSS